MSTFSDDKMEKMFKDEHVLLLDYFEQDHTKQSIIDTNDIYNCDTEIVVGTSKVQSLIWIYIPLQ